VLDTPGYDTNTKLYFRPSPDLKLPPIPSEPTLAEVKAAAACCLAVIEEFPFDGPASHANALGMMVTPILRPAIAGPVPMGLFTKPRQGTGASLLINCINIIATGQPAALTAYPESEEEMGKKLMAFLLEGRSIITFDNLSHTVESSKLAAVLTAERWCDRILGLTEERSVPKGPASTAPETTYR